MDLVQKGASLFVISEKGFGKRINFQNFAAKGRGGKGMAYIKVSDKNGSAIGLRSVLPNDEIIITAKSGMTIRLLAKDISTQGRATVGVKVIDIQDDDLVTDFAVISDEGNDA